MKISKADFEQMKAKYDLEVKKGKPGKNQGQDIDDQTNWISYTKEDLMEVLGKEGVTGIKFYFTEYSKEVAEKLYGPDADLYVGKLGLVYSPIYANSPSDRSDNVETGEEYYDRGTTCPPTCQ